MAKIQTFKRIIKEDVPEQFRDLVDKIGFSVNSFADDVTNALNNNLTISDNLNMQIKDFTTQLDIFGSPTMSLVFRSTLVTSCQGIIVIKVVNLTNSSIYPTASPFISFNENNKLITINNITGLQAGNKYQIRILAIG